MKNLLLVLFLIVSCFQNSFCQELDLLNEIQNKIYENQNVQVGAEFPKSGKSFNMIVKENLEKESIEILKNEILVSFIVEIDGVISNVEITDDINENLKDKIKNVITKSPKWVPAEHEGYRVKVKIKVKLQF